MSAQAPAQPQLGTAKPDADALDPSRRSAWHGGQPYLDYLIEKLLRPVSVGQYRLEPPSESRRPPPRRTHRPTFVGSAIDGRVGRRCLA